MLNSDLVDYPYCSFDIVGEMCSLSTKLNPYASCVDGTSQVDIPSLDYDCSCMSIQGDYICLPLF